jgi:hypothetical protein
LVVETEREEHFHNQNSKTHPLSNNYDPIDLRPILYLNQTGSVTAIVRPFLYFSGKRIKNDEVCASSVGGVIPRNEDFSKYSLSTVKPQSNVI